MKFDFLVCVRSTIINWALEMINKRRAKNGEPPLDIAAIPLDNKKSFDMLQRPRKPLRYSSLNRAA